MFDFKKFPKLDVTDTKGIIAHGKKIVKGYLSVREATHVQLVACAEHAIRHSDCSLLTEFYTELPNNANLRLVKKWITEYTSFVWTKNSAGKEMFLGRGKKGEKLYEFKLEGTTTPFYEMPGAEAEKKDWSLDVKFDAMIAEGIKRNKRGELNDFDKFELEYLVKAKLLIKDAWKHKQENREPASAENNVIEMHEAA